MPPLWEYDVAGLIWYYGPSLLVIAATWSGLRQARDMSERRDAASGSGRARAGTQAHAGA
ncbi:hypothetical protein OHA25_42795 [Nonomuraea sp. NBC_00507]|uniref:hypothetical protein n=1 Tax=Nonomuraea sp. NBC_00507 TaxID=2976002 RepID=UPI002E182967